MALALLKRSDSNLMLPVACDDPIALAANLSILQPFTVDVVGVWPALAGRLSFVQQALWPRHAGNGWFRADVLDAKQVIHDVCQRQVATNAENPQAPVADARDTASDTNSAPCERQPSVGIDPSWQTLLQDCPRAQADKATTIRKALKYMLGPIEAAAILGQYRECALRVATGGCQRFIVNGSGATMKLAKSEKEEKATEGAKDT